ncbi:MAG: hypothetical protein HC831_02795 [Chloroflexia bacterium]|nr:hypothetical protein [Chloroflexia bacterium]
MEFSAFVDVLGWAGVDYGHKLFVDTCGFTDKVISTFNVPVLVDKTIEEINADEYDALAIPGGFGEFGFYEEVYDERFLTLMYAIQQTRLSSIDFYQYIGAGDFLPESF